MKQKILFLLAIVAIVFSACKKAETKDEKPAEDSVSVAVETPADMHTAKNALDWEGEYKGITPCEDCDGVETSVMLNMDSTFVQSLTYIGKGGPYESKGTFTWDETGNKVTLNFEDGSVAKYLVGEGNITLLDDYGNRIEGDDYVLRK